MIEKNNTSPLKKKEITMSKKQLFILSFALIFSCLSLGFFTGLIAKNTNVRGNTSANIQRDLEMFATSLNIILSNYVITIDVDDIIEASIKGMLEELDPYSVYIDSTEYARMRENTTGEFGGLGIEIGIRADWLTVIAPMDGTPAVEAGLVSGDQIRAIDGESTEGITTIEAVSLLRGKPGTDVTISVLHPGQTETQDITITREIIVIHSVTYSTLIKNTNIGYIRLANFYENATSEVSESIEELLSEGAEKFILDLRSNPGGLLIEAVGVSNCFLPKGATIVYTKGRTSGEHRFYADEQPLIPDVPLIVMVNFASASASEIVGGAIQDHDRGLLIGSRTFGKGSVQSIFPLDRGKLGAVKLTTSRYYTPTGRLIDTGHTRTKEQIEEDVSLTDSVTFTTMGPLEREVYGGGGIFPDFLYYNPLLTSVETSMLSKNLFFTFARDYILQHINLNSNFYLTETLIDSFIEIAKENEIEIDSLTEHEEYYIERQLYTAIANAAFGPEGRYEENLEWDKELQVAINILHETNTTLEIFEVAENNKEFENLDSIAIAFEDSIRKEF